MKRKLRVFRIQRSLVLPILVLAVISVFLMQQHPVFGTTSRFDQGYQNGRSDYLEGYSKDPSCDPYNTAPNPDAFCAAYRTGYEAGWLAASLLYGN